MKLTTLQLLSKHGILKHELAVYYGIKWIYFWPFRDG